MLLTDFVAHLTNITPQLSTIFTVSDFVRFMSLAAKVQHTAGQGLQLTPTHFAPIIPFVMAALKLEFPSNLIQQIWTIAFDLLPSSCINPKSSIQQIGLLHNHHDFKLAEQYLCFPVSRCLVCKRSPNLHVHSHLNG
ncbi:hypothetical protein DFH28DRAFT_833348, partial [Melampsora americana]